MSRKSSKNTKRTVQKRKKEVSRFSLPAEIKKWMFGLGFFLAAIIVVLSFFGKAGLAGEKLMGFLSFLIGDAAFIIPLSFVLGGLVFINSKYKESLGLAFAAQLFFIFGIAGILGSIDGPLKRGGWIGYLISAPFLRIFGDLVTKIVFIVIIIAGVLLFWYLAGKPSFFPRKTNKIKEKNGDEKEESVSIKRVFEPKFKVREIPNSLASLQVDIASSRKQEEKDSQPLLELKKKSIENNEEEISYPLPSSDLLEKDKGGALAGDVKINSSIIKRALQNFDIQVEISEVNTGPTVTQYALKPAEGIKLSKITVLSNDLALALASHPIRIEAPIPGRPLVGIEVPNKVRAIVRLKELIENQNFQNSVSDLILCLGRDVAGNPVFTDLAKMPHLLVAGATGTGKTICLNTIILSLLYKNSPDNLKLILVDPKRVEFPIYNELPHLLCPVILDSLKAVNALKWLIGEMERRFKVLSDAKARDIVEFNQKRVSGEKSRNSESEKNDSEKMPYIVLIVDELADLMAAKGREIEAGVVRLAQMARAVGIHLILATQRPSVEVITGLIKANVTSRITFQVASQIDSRTVLDTSGAEKLLGSGDMLFTSAEIIKPKRIQCAYVSKKEVNRVVGYIVSRESVVEEKDDILKESEDGQKSLTAALEESSFSEGEDPLYEEAKEVVIEARKASASLLQRRLRIGYARAARLIDTLEERGVVGPGEGAKPREIYLNE